jgi:predicted nucleotidyltransferase
MDRNNVKGINKEIADIVDKYIAIVKENYDVVAIILFGSYAKGTENEDSDIDIAVVTDDIKTDKFDEEVKLTLLRRKIDSRIEPHIIKVDDYENDETPFVVEVKNTGIKVA